MKRDYEHYTTRVLTSTVQSLASGIPIYIWHVGLWGESDIRTTLIQGSDILCWNISLQNVQLLLKLFFFSYHMVIRLNLYLCFLLMVMELHIWNFVQSQIMNLC